MPAFHAFKWLLPGGSGGSRALPCAMCRYLASGQMTNMGFIAAICIWDLSAGGTLKHRLMLQKVKINALAFSPDSSRLASLGGHDDNSLVLWAVESGVYRQHSAITNIARS